MEAAIAALRKYFGLLALLLPVVALYSQGLNVGEFWSTDESRHAMNGVFMLDLFRDRPWAAPMDYALRYFAQYPALALNWYPPGFYIVEAFFYWMFGISEFTARLTSLVFLVVGLIFFYRWASEIWGRSVAVLAGLIFCLSPQSILWGRALMLDVPATAMVMVSIYYFDRYLKCPNLRRATYFGLALSATLLVKQSTIFIVPAFLVYFLVTKRSGLLIRREFLAPLVLTLFALAFLIIHAVKFGGTGIAATAGDLHSGGGGKAPFFTAARWLLYGQVILESNAWPFVAAAIVGIWVTLTGVRRVPQDAILILWLIGWYIMCTVLFAVPANSQRYTIYAMPALALLACRSVDLVPWKSCQYGLLGLLGVYVLSLGYNAARAAPGYVKGYQQAAEVVLASPVRGTVMFAGKHDGNFTLHMRAGDMERRRVILRGDKTLVTMSVHKYFGVQSHVHDADDVRGLLERYNVAWVVVDRPNIAGIDEFDLLWTVLQGPDFRREREIAVKTNLSEYHGLTIEVYRRLAMPELNTKTLSVTVPVLGHDVIFPL